MTYVIKINFKGEVLSVEITAPNKAKALSKAVYHFAKRYQLSPALLWYKITNGEVRYSVSES